jgi:hypothetical protein
LFFDLSGGLAACLHTYRQRFAEIYRCSSVSVEVAASTLAQVRKLGPDRAPSVELKKNDKLRPAYEARYGVKVRWELDVLDTAMLSRLVEHYVLAHRDEKFWQAAVEHERSSRADLAELAESFGCVVSSQARISSEKARGIKVCAAPN